VELTGTFIQSSRDGVVKARGTGHRAQALPAEASMTRRVSPKDKAKAGLRALAKSFKV
jgi:hypothetical protein